MKPFNIRIVAAGSAALTMLVGLSYLEAQVKE
jgi:hypothetical protein